MGPLATAEEGPSRSPIKSSQTNEETPSKVQEVQAILSYKKKSKEREKENKSIKEASLHQEVMIRRGLIGKKEGSSRAPPLIKAMKNSQAIYPITIYTSHPLLRLCVLETCARCMMKLWGYSVARSLG
jgi:hypothetical protein